MVDWTRDRISDILAARKRGVKVSDIARFYDITPGRVHQILKKGFNGFPEQAPMPLCLHKDASVWQEFGVDHHWWKRCRRCGMVSNYRRQKWHRSNPVPG